MTINLAASPPCDRKTIVCDFAVCVWARARRVKAICLLLFGISNRSYASNAQINRFFPKRINRDGLSWVELLNSRFFVQSHKLTSFELVHYDFWAHSWYHNNVLERRNAKLMAIDHILHKFSGPLSSRRRFTSASSMKWIETINCSVCVHVHALKRHDDDDDDDDVGSSVKIRIKINSDSASTHPEAINPTQKCSLSNGNFRAIIFPRQDT